MDPAVLRIPTRPYTPVRVFDPDTHRESVQQPGSKHVKRFLSLVVLL